MVILMLNCASVYTYEVDDPETALADIKTQLDEKIIYLKNTVGMVMCNIEFISSGVLRYICENLPFDIAGTTTASQAVNDEAGDLILTLFIMTSDDISFKAGVTESLRENTYERTKAAYEKLKNGETEQPKLIIAYAPFLIDLHSGDEYVRIWSKIIPGTPLFGTITTDDTATFNDCETIFNGVNMKDAMSFVLFYGDINPRFLIATLPEDNVLSLRGTITGSKENFVYTVNNTTIRDFFNESGIKDIKITTPIMVSSAENEAEGEVPVIRALYAYTDDGAGIFAGDIEEGSTFSLLSFSSKVIKSTFENEVKEIGKYQDVNGAILFSCASRRMALMGDNEESAEQQIARNALGKKLPFIMGYSGGEMCPVIADNGKLVNRFHNYSAIVLLV